MYVGIMLGVALVTAAGLVSLKAIREGQSMSGIVVKYNEAALDVEQQPGVSSTLKVDRIVAPGPSWVVVTQVVMGPTKGMGESDKPAAPAGAMPTPRILAVVAVPAGESRDLIIPLDPGVPVTQMLRVALHADRGIAGTFEWDMTKFAESPDKPYFREPLQAVHSPLELSVAVLAK